MEQHPVPQNILEVEFKLFGAFTLKQFVKILFGCLFALFIYILQLPFYIKFPIMIASVLIGAGLAIMPNLGVWLSGFTKSLFVSPRYVWIKSSNAPKILTVEKAKTVQPIKVNSKRKRPNLSEISLDQILNTKGTTDRNKVDDPMDGEQLTSLDKILTDVYKSQPKQAAPVAVQTAEQYNSQIESLKRELSTLSKDRNYRQREAQILSQINDLYRKMGVPSYETSNFTTQTLRDQQGKKLNEKGQLIFGIIVDKADKIIDNAVIKFINNSSNTTYLTRSAMDGRFMSQTQLPSGNYEVKIEKPGFKFNTYRITVGNAKLPAYKLRAR